MPLSANQIFSQYKPSKLLLLFIHLSKDVTYTNVFIRSCYYWYTPRTLREGCGEVTIQRVVADMNSGDQYKWCTWMTYPKFLQYRSITRSCAISTILSDLGNHGRFLGIPQIVKQGYRRYPHKKLIFKWIVECFSAV